MSGGSWRETASQETQDALDGLPGGGVSFAEQLVAKHGEFYPFALALEAGAAEPEMLMAVDDLSPEALGDSAQMIEHLEAIGDLTGGPAEPLIWA